MQTQVLFGERLGKQGSHHGHVALQFDLHGCTLCGQNHREAFIRGPVPSIGPVGPSIL